jgi:hypothetical protein
MPTEDIAASRRALVTSGKLLEALAASPNQDEDVSLYAMQHFDRLAVHYVQQLGREQATDLRAEVRPRYSSMQGARTTPRTTPPDDER